MPRPPVNVPVTVGTSAVQLDSTLRDVYENVIVKADDANTGTVYVGYSDSVATSGADRGFPLTAGQGLEITIQTLKHGGEMRNTDIYAIASEAGQEVDLHIQ